MKSLSLNGTWSLRYSEAGEGERAGWPNTGVGGDGSYQATVPGDVHLDLARAGVIPEPLFGSNAEECRWMEDKDWWYSTEFALSDDFLPTSAGSGRVQLSFEGLDTLADIWLNGTYVDSTRNAFIAHSLDVTGLVRPGSNLLVVRLDTGLRWACTQECDRYRWPGDATMAERIWLRRAQYTGGWDWGPRLLTAGIWRPVALRTDERLALRDVHLITERADDDWAAIRVQYEIDNLSEEDVDATIDLAFGGEGGGRKQLAATLVPGYNLVVDSFHLASPRLWWPNGIGEPYLYQVEATVSADGTAYDATTFRYGIRLIELIQQPLAGDEGQSFALAVNGRRIYCKGADWVPADSIPANVTAAKYRALVQEAAGANFNMLRVWGGGVYEDDAWWDACDELGILVWQDFMFACSAIPDDVPAFAEQIDREGRFVVRRLRNRASLALWCGNNENQWLAGRAAPHTLACGRRTYHEILATICAQLD
ncbi:MAG: glycoside hydrolase family 2 protein, partial [Anaerolineae bacterium]